MSDLQAQIAEKKRKVEELRKAKLNQSLTQNDPLMKSISEMQQKQEEQKSQFERSKDQSPEKSDKKDQPVNLLTLFMEQKRKKLGFCQVEIYGAQPHFEEDKTTFEFGVQCDLQPASTQNSHKKSFQAEDDDELPSQTNTRRISLKRKPDVAPQAAPVERAAPVPQDKKALSAEEITSIVKSNSFNQFFQRGSKLIEKALSSHVVDTLEGLMANDTVQRDDEMKDILTHQVSFFDQNYSFNRVVTALQWSPLLPETFLTAYSQNEEGSINDQVGVALIWSLQLRSRPEFYCFCQSPVTSAIFHPFSPSLVLGGLYNGQLVLWDLRTKQTPDKRTTLSSGGHSYPIFSISMVGSQNAHNVVSVSNDGKLCIWNLAMFTQPQKVVDMKTRPKQAQTSNNQMSEINVTSMITPRDDANNFYVGAEDGSIYHSQLHPNQVQAENQYKAFEDHQAPITGLSLNDPSQQVSPLFQNLLLSSSFDWSVKLWNPRSDRDSPLLSFEAAEDYIYDVSWNGNHPTLFSSVDGEGYVDLWDVSSDIEAPINRFKTGNFSLNKQCWSRDGQRLAVGDSQGNVQILSLDKRALRVDQDKLSSFEAFVRSQR